MRLAETLQKAHQSTSHITDRLRSGVITKGRTNELGIGNLSRMFVGEFHQPDKGIQRTAEWSANYESLLKLYKGSVFICVGAVARCVASAGVRVFRKYVNKTGEHREPVSSDHPLVDLLSNPNPFCSAYSLHFFNAGWRLLCGNSYVHKVRNGFQTPVALWPLSPQHVKVIPDSANFIKGYRINAYYYGASDWEVDRSEMIHLKETSLDQSGTQRFYGYPPALAAENTIELENDMYARLRHNLSNFANPGLVFKTKKRLHPHMLAQLVNEIVAQHKLAEHTGRPMVVHDDMELISGINNKEKELDYRGSLADMLKITAAVFGVPLPVLGVVGDNNRAEAEAAIISWGKYRLNPELKDYGQCLTQCLATDFERDRNSRSKLEIQVGPFDTTNPTDLVKSFEAAGKLGSATPNEVRDALLDLPPFKEGGDKPILQAGVQEGVYGNSPGYGRSVASGDEIVNRSKGLF